MNQKTIASAILWVAAIATIVYLFQGNDNVVIAAIIVSVLAAVDLGLAIYKK